jgi:hypothetical protein
LTGYYHKFFKNYGQIVTPLTSLLKKESFFWTEEATKDFEKLKEAMCTNFVLATPNFTKKIIVKCDASGHGIGAVLMQERRTLAFGSSQLKGKKLVKPIYENEMLAILHIVNKWHLYLCKNS